MPDRPAVTLRSLALGLAGVTLICGVTPFNNFAANNTFLVGSLLPVGLLMFLAVVVLAANAPLHRVAPRLALSPGELSTALAMALVSCTLPSSGLMRYLPANLIGLQARAATDPTARATLDAAPVAAWLFPTVEGDTPQERGADPAVRNYLGRTPGRADGVAGALAAVPWSAWGRPAVAWGAFLACVYGATLCGSAVVRGQWVANERLAFPLAEVLSSLVEPPAAGRSVPPVFTRASFWVAGGAVLFVHGLGGLSAYDPRWPAVPVGYDLGGLFADEPWAFATYGLKHAKLMFTVVGVTYFISSKVAFSLVAGFFAYNAWQVAAGPMHLGVDLPQQRDQTLGALLVLAGTIAYTGRRHWAAVGRSMIRRGGADDPYLAPAVAGWGLVACATGAAAWLWMAGSPPLNAVLIVVALLTAWLVLARLVADTGLIYCQLHTPIVRPWAFGASLGLTTTGPGALLSNVTTGVLGHDLRENAAAYATTALATADRRGVASARRSRGLVPAVALALVVGYLVAGASTLATEYAYAATLDVSGQSPLNGYGVEGSVLSQILGPTAAYLSPAGPAEAHSKWLHLTGGAAAMLGVTVGHLTLAGFPLHPAGLAMAYAFPLQHVWLSVLAGLVAKTVVLRLGGASLYRAARPAFLGLVLSESAAVGMWAVASLALLALGVPYKPINLLLP